VELFGTTNAGFGIFRLAFDPTLWHLVHWRMEDPEGSVYRMLYRSYELDNVSVARIPCRSVLTTAVRCSVSLSSYDGKDEVPFSS